jgi:hypothetical protein
MFNLLKNRLGFPSEFQSLPVFQLPEGHFLLNSEQFHPISLQILYPQNQRLVFFAQYVG